MVALNRMLGFLLGFGLVFFTVMGASVVYRGLWMPLALIGLLTTVFSLHPILREGSKKSGFLLAFGFVAVGLWMSSVGPSPVRILQTFANLLPLPLILIGLVLAIRFGAINQREESWPIANCILFGALGWIVVSLSGSQGGANPMVQYVMDHFGWDRAKAQQAVIIFRKCIHFTGYGLVGLNSFRLAEPRQDLKRAALFGVGIAACFAAFDEFRQTTSVGRTGSAWDVGLDLCGAITFIGLGVLRYRQVNPPGNLPRNVD